LNEVGGGSTAFHKSVSQLLAWKSNGRFLEIDYDRVGEVILQDNKGAPSKIAQLRPDKGNAGLGYMMAVDASQRDEFENRKSKIFQICVGAQSSRLSFKEAKQLLEQRLLMQTKYGLHLSQFTEKQCKELTVRINATFLPKLHIHSKMKRAVVWGPRSLGGLGLNTDIYSLQCQCAVSYLIRTMRWDEIVANDILVVTDAFQIASGFESPVLENTMTPIEYVCNGWIPHLRKMLRKIEGSIWIEKAWSPKRQRQYDQAIMEVFANNPSITPMMLKIVNELRMWLRVIFISELADVREGRLSLENDCRMIVNGGRCQQKEWYGPTRRHQRNCTGRHFENVFVSHSARMYRPMEMFRITNWTNHWVNGTQYGGMWSSKRIG
jgi:hypothetical protein